MSINKLLQKAWSNKVFRFITIGVINTLTDISILNFLIFAFGLKEIVANLISASISISLSYFWNHYFVFRHQHKVNFKMFVKFFVITGFGVLGIQELVISVIEHFVKVSQVMNTLGLHHSISVVILDNGAKLIAVAVSMVWNFFLYTFAIFKEDKEEEGIVPY